MTPRRLLVRSLVHYRAVNAAVALGVAVGAAVLTGALMVGTSVRGSLRGLTLDRLGAIDHAAVGDRYFRESVSEDLAGLGGAATAVVARASAEHGSTGARASKVAVQGVDRRFWDFYGTPVPRLGPREIAINRRLADELGAGEGDAVLLRIRTDDLVPAESVMGRKADSVRLLRLQVATVLEDAGPGRFGLSPRQQRPLNAFAARETLQRALEQPGRANALFVAGGTVAEVEAAWRDAFSGEDAALAFRTLPDGAGLIVESERVTLDEAAAAAVHAAAAAAGLRSSEVLTYLANTIAANGRAIPYSTVTALQDWPASLRLADGSALGDLRPGEIVLNEWAARDVGARAGQDVELAYYVVGPGSTLETASRAFRLAGVARMDGAALDSDYAPPYRGMTDRTRMSDWNPPFPIDLRLIRPRDEDYWDRYRAAPKAFVSLSDAKALWTSRFGQLTSIRVSAPPRTALQDAVPAFREALRQRLDPAAFGLSIQPVKRIGLDAASGATDFAGLFVGFSLFLIASAAILVALLFRLGVERRSREVGALLATGHSPRLVRSLLFAEGGLLALAGCILGVPGGVAYAQLMILGLNTWWSGAVGGSFLAFHFRWVDPVVGAVAAQVLMLVAIRLAVRQLTRLSPNALLAGKVEPAAGAPGQDRRARRLRWVAAGCGALALALLGLSTGGDASARVGSFFGAGSLALVAALILFRAELLARGRRREAVTGIAQLGLRNGRRNPTRSVLSAALVACASFMIVTVAMNRHDVAAEEPDFASGDGGFRIVAEADAPLFRDRIEEVAAGQPGIRRVVPLRVRAGEDASCLNLYQPSEPTLAGVPGAMIRRGGFAFQKTLAATDEERANPWLLLEKDFGGAVPVFGDANSTAWILHLGVGDELEVEGGSGERRRLLLAGVLSRSIFQSELLLSEERFLEIFPGHSGYQGLLVETDSNRAAVALEEAFADEGLDAVRTSERLAGFLIVENTYLSTFRTLGGLGLLLGTLGLAVVMARSVLERRGELALLEALGFASGPIARLIVAENAFLLLFGVGTGTAAALLAVAPHLAGGAADPPWLPLAATLGVVVALGLLAGVVAAVLALRAPLLPSLRRD